MVCLVGWNRRHGPQGNVLYGVYKYGKRGESCMQKLILTFFHKLAKKCRILQV